MAAEQYPVEVQSDFLEKITRARPIPALAELIWNSFDADATVVDVSFEYNDLGSLDAIVVKDNGAGIARTEARIFPFSRRLMEKVQIAHCVRSVSTWAGRSWTFQGVRAWQRR